MLSSTFPRYLLAGAGAFSVDYAAFLLLWKLAGVSYLVANGAGIALGFVVSFVANRHYTFRHAASDHSAPDHAASDHAASGHSTPDHSTPDHAASDHSTPDLRTNVNLQRSTIPRVSAAHHPWPASFVRFGLANLLSLCLASLMLFLLVQGMGVRADAAKIAVSALVPLSNFLMYRHFVFPRTDS